MKVIVQMDPVNKLNLETDSTICVIEEGLRLGFSIYYYIPQDLYLNGDDLIAKAGEVKLEHGKCIFEKATQELRLKDFDILFVRQDPPVDMRYITTTYLLDKISSNTLVINKGIRDLPEKVFTLTKFSKFMPSTIITENLEVAEGFFDLHDACILKPLYACGGRDISKFDRSKKHEFIDAFKVLVQKYSAPIMLQEFLPSIKLGDKRVILIDGEIAGALNRIPMDGSITANIASGGQAQKTKLTEKEIKICNEVGRELKNRGVVFAGLDLIGGYLTEINITSPTGIIVINKLYNLQGDDRLESKLWRSITRLC